MNRLMIAPQSMIVVGVTGGIASGKSTVSRQLAAAGLPVIDADAVARLVVRPGTKGLRSVVNAFGNDILLPNGELDRHSLGQQVFSNGRKRRQLNSLLQPVIKDEIDAQIAHYQELGKRVVVLDIPLLFETGYAQDCDRIVVVNIKPDLQIKRLMARNGYSRQEASQRIHAQMPLAAKVARADFVINNNGDKEALTKAVQAFLETLPVNSH